MAELVVAGWFLSTIISKSADLLINYAKYRIECHINVKSNLENLTNHLNKIKAAIHEAERRPVNNPGLRGWLLRLKDEVYSAEDVLDTFSYEILRGRITGKSKTGGAAVKLDEIVNKFHGFVNNMGEFLKTVEMNDNKANNKSHTTHWRITTPYQPQPPLVGRSTELAELKSFLLHPTSDGKPFSSISLLGVGGVGKTAIARLTYNDQIVESYFGIRAWVCVTHAYDVKSLMIQFIESAELERPPDLHQIENLGAIQNIIKKGVQGKRFLVVLDDVWNNMWFSDWFSVPLSHGKEGSRVVLTTRHKSIVTEQSTAKRMINVERLKFNACYDLLYGHAFHPLEKTGYRLLECICHEITKSLCGLPLVVETIGRALGQNQSENHWRDILARNIYDVRVEQQLENKLLASMRLSYEQLNDGALQQCFLSCSLFPFGHEFCKAELIRIWMALGFLWSKDRTMENVGENYFSELVNRQFFKKVQGDNYEMHGALHQLAEYLSYSEYYRINSLGDYDTRSSNIEIPDTTRHVGLDVNDLSRASSSLAKKTNLWSLVITGRRSYYPNENENPFSTLEKILKEEKCLRVLILSDLMPKSFDQPTHLRYFNIGLINDDDDAHERTITLPDWLRKCYHLQSFSAEFVHNNVILPEHMNRLIMLRWLETNPETMHTIPGIGTMVSLQEMREFHVQNEPGFEVKQLQKMNELKGHLYINNLENIEKVDDAVEAELYQKKHLRSLMFRWSKGKVRKLSDDVVLENLRPHNLIRKRELNGYMGEKFPKWLRVLEYLGQLSLINCKKLHSALMELKDMPSLKVLIVFNCPLIDSFPINMLPPNLEKLKVDGHNVDISSRNNAQFPNNLTPQSTSNPSSENNLTPQSRPNPTSENNLTPQSSPKPASKNNLTPQSRPNPASENNLTPQSGGPKPASENNLTPQSGPKPASENNLTPQSRPNPASENNLTPQSGPKPASKNNLTPQRRPKPASSENNLTPKKNQSCCRIL